MKRFWNSIKNILPNQNEQALTAETPENPVIVELSSDQIAASYFIFWVNYDIGSGRFSLAFKGSLYRDGILNKLQEMGYNKRMLDNTHFMLVHEQSNILSEVSPEVMKDDFFHSQLPENGPALEVYYNGAYISISIELQRECFLSQSGQIFNKSFLEHLQTNEKPELRDDAHSTYVPYLNTIACLSSEGIKTIQYADLEEACVWQDHIIGRNLTLTHDFLNSHYAQFISNVAGSHVKQTAFKSAIGYLLNNYNQPSRGQVVMCYDEKPSKIDEPSGGTGKGLFSNGIKQIRNVLKVDGKKIRQDDRFRFQGITTRTQVFWIDDAHKDFPFEVLHSVSTDGWSIEKKFKDEFFIPAEKGPKILMCSNVILSGGGSTNKRRQFILEFSDHYSKHIITGAEEPIKDQHGCIFFDNHYWNEAEWSKFDSYMLNCGVEYFKYGLKPYTQVGQEKSRLIQTTDETFVDWSNDHFCSLQPEYDTKVLYEQFCIVSGDNLTTVNQRVFNRWLYVLAESNNWSASLRKSNGRQHISFTPKK